MRWFSASRMSAESDASLRDLIIRRGEATFDLAVIIDDCHQEEGPPVGRLTPAELCDDKKRAGQKDFLTGSFNLRTHWAEFTNTAPLCARGDVNPHVHKDPGT